MLPDYFLSNSSIQLSITVLIKIFIQLSQLQSQQSFFTFEDISTIISEAFSSLTAFETHLYTNLFIQSCSLSLISNPESNQSCFQMPTERLFDEHYFIHQVLKIVEKKMHGESSPSLEKFREDVFNFLNSKFHAPPSQSPIPSESSDSFNALPSLPSSNSIQNISVVTMSSKETLPSFSLNSTDKEAGIKKEKVAKKEIKKDASLTYFFYVIRQHNMDILQPICLHDKAMFFVYLSLLVFGSLSHNQLINVTLMLKDNRAVNKKDQLSKTKLRGIISLLKAAGVVMVQRNELDQALIFLVEDIKDYDNIRSRHDAYLIKFLADNDLETSRDTLKDILWDIPIDIRRYRLDLIEKDRPRIFSILESLPKDFLEMDSLEALRCEVKDQPSMKGFLDSSSSSSLLSHRDIFDNNLGFFSRDGSDSKSTPESFYSTISSQFNSSLPPSPYQSPYPAQSQNNHQITNSNGIPFSGKQYESPRDQHFNRSAEFDNSFSSVSSRGFGSRDSFPAFSHIDHSQSFNRPYSQARNDFPQKSINTRLNANSLRASLRQSVIDSHSPFQSDLYPGPSERQFVSQNSTLPSYLNDPSFSHNDRFMNRTSFQNINGQELHRNSSIQPNSLHNRFEASSRFPSGPSHTPSQYCSQPRSNGSQFNPNRNGPMTNLRSQNTFNRQSQQQYARQRTTTRPEVNPTSFFMDNQYPSDYFI